MYIIFDANGRYAGKTPIPDLAAMIAVGIGGSVIPVCLS